MIDRNQMPAYDLIKFLFKRFHSPPANLYSASYIWTQRTGCQDCFSSLFCPYNNFKDTTIPSSRAKGNN